MSAKGAYADAKRVRAIIAGAYARIRSAYQEDRGVRLTEEECHAIWVHDSAVSAMLEEFEEDEGAL